MDWIPLAGGGVDLSQQLAVIAERSVRLTTKERDLLAYLAQNPGRTVTRQELLVNVWGNPASGSEEPVYSAIKRLRAKIDGGPHRHIVGVHGDGYRWEPVPPAPNRSRQTRGRFFGRDDELAAIERALGGGAHLITLVGPGGAGKTRCARELAASRAHAFCDLASATTEAQVVTAIASGLGVPLDGVEPVDWARGVGLAIAAQRDRLVVLDNAEQVIDVVAPIVSAWLPDEPTLLVTSREPLQLAGERVILLGPLPVEAAVSLLVDRVGPGGDESEDLATYGAIVERVDRLPLAIELAAVQLRDLGAKPLLDSLSSQLHTLVSGPRDAPTRHSTLRRAVEWSWSFMSERERQALVELAVFVAPFNLEAARAVAGDDIASTLSQLVRRCQIQRDGDRFALYSAVRELALEQTSDAAAATRHAELFARTGEAAVEALEHASHREGAVALGRDLGELRAAFEHALGVDASLAGRLGLVLDRALGLRAERAALRRQLLARARAGVSEHGLLRARLLLAEARLEGASSDLFDEALALATGTPLHGEVLLARAERTAPSDPELAGRDLEAALSNAATARATRGRLLALQGEVAWSRGLVHEASEKLRVAAAIHAEVGDRRASARTYALLAHLDRMETGGGAARALLDQAEAAADELGDPVVAAHVLLDLGQHLTRVGDQAAARAALDLAARTYERLGFARHRALLHLHVAETLVGVGDHDGALKEAVAAWSALPDEVVQSTVHEAVACIQMLRGELSDAKQWLDRGLEIARKHGAARSECTLLGKAGLVALATGDFEGAFAQFDAATSKNEARGSVTILGASLADRAMASFAPNRDADGHRDLDRARALLHAPPEEQTQGRMLAACEAVGRGYGSIRAGVPAERAHRETRALTARFFTQEPHEWDVVLRLLDWLIDRIAQCPAVAPAPR